MFLKIEKITKEVFNSHEELGKGVNIKDVLGKYILIQTNNDFVDKDEIGECKMKTVSFIEIEREKDGTKNVEKRQIVAYKDKEGIWVKEKHLW